MHGRFGGPGRIRGHGDLIHGDVVYDDLGFDCPAHTTLVDARRIGNGLIDYDFYRARAAAERTRVRRAALMALTRFIRRVVQTIGRKGSPAG
jgi:hypothetical protein